MLTYLIFGITYAFAAGVQPGPLQTYLISQTIKKGWKLTLPAALAPVLSDLPIVLLVLFLLKSLPESFISFLRLGGGVFLVYLGYKAYLSWKAFSPNEIMKDQSGKKTLFSAVVVNVLNPNPYLGWSLIMGPMFLEGWKIEPINGIVLIVGFYITIVLTLGFTIILFDFARKLGPKISKILLGISALVLVLFGLYQIIVGVKTII